MLNILKNQMKFIMIYHFYQRKMKIGKVLKLVANLHNKKEYVVNIQNLQKALNHRLVFKKMHRTTESNQEAWLKPYTDMHAKLRKNGKPDLERIFSN